MKSEVTDSTRKRFIQDQGLTLMYAWFPTYGDPNVATLTSDEGYVVAAQVPQSVASAAPREWPVQTTCITKDGCILELLSSLKWPFAEVNSNVLFSHTMHFPHISHTSLPRLQQLESGYGYLPSAV
jgi:hypothetical protein